MKLRISRIVAGEDRWRFSDGKNTVDFIADFSRGAGYGQAVLAASSEWGNSDELIEEVARLSKILRDTGGDEAGASEEELAGEHEGEGDSADDVYRPFPVGELPEQVRDLVTAGAKALGCDPAQIALPALAAISVAIGNSRWIMVKTSWVEPVVLWLISVLPSGSLKSPAQDLALEPLRKGQHRAILNHRLRMQEYESEKDEWESQPKKMRGREPTPPTCPRLLVSDITIEALVERLAEQESQRGFLCDRDEQRGWFDSMNQYKAKGGSDESSWLSIHRAGPVLNDRKTGLSKMQYVQRAFVSVVGTIQPGILRRALTEDRRESGLAARLLLAMPPVAPRRWSDATVSDRVKSRYASMLGKLLKLGMGGVAGDPEPIYLPLTAEAYALWGKHYNEWNSAPQACEEGDIAAAWSKLEGGAARLALAIHCCRVVEGQADPDRVDADSIRSGIALAKWFAGEAERIYTMLGGDGESDEMQSLVRYIRGKGGQITARELTRSWRKYRKSGAARDALCSLVEAKKGRWMFPTPGAGGGHPLEVFQLFDAPTQPTHETAKTPRRGDTTPHGDIAAGGCGSVTSVTGGECDGEGVDPHYSGNNECYEEIDITTYHTNTTHGDNSTDDSGDGTVTPEIDPVSGGCVTSGGGFCGDAVAEVTL